jgi:hypothetical protein
LWLPVVLLVRLISPSSRYACCCCCIINPPDWGSWGEGGSAPV